MDRFTQIALRLDRLQLLHHASRRVQMRALGLWRGQMPILEYVLEHEGCSQASLAQELGLSAATVAVSTKRMERAGLITKTADGENLRCNKLCVTEEGREKARAGQQIARQHNEKVFGVLTEAQQETLCRLLDQLIDSFGEQSRDLQPIENFILHNKLEKEETR